MDAHYSIKPRISGYASLQISRDFVHAQAAKTEGTQATKPPAPTLRKISELIAELTDGKQIYITVSSALFNGEPAITMIIDGPNMRQKTLINEWKDEVVEVLIQLEKAIWGETGGLLVLTFNDGTGLTYAGN